MSKGKLDFWDPILFWIVSGVTTFCIGAASFFKMLDLSDGGSVIASDLGGREVSPHTEDFHERQYTNIVQEMSISAGIPVPGIWVLDQEEGINAFAAGTEPGNAVIAVTRGCLLHLNREELQGVVAHEFSHILNGDMRLNMRLTGFLFGLLFISMMGRTILHFLGYFKEKKSIRTIGIPPILLIPLIFGITFLIVGSIGSFFSHLIQAAISRQREYLADASAVQFTRNASGISNALKKIGGISTLSKINSPKAPEASHLFFANALISHSFLATHPPIEKRIRAITPSWNGEYITLNQRPNQAKKKEALPKSFWQLQNGLVYDHITPITLLSLGEATKVDCTVGRILEAGLKKEWISQISHPKKACALIFALILSKNHSPINEDHTSDSNFSLDLETNDFIRYWIAETHSLHSCHKIALIDLSIPALKRLPRSSYDAFISEAHRAISHDGVIDLFESVLLRVVERHLNSSFYPSPPPPIHYRHIKILEQETNFILSTLVHFISDSLEKEKTYQSAISDFTWSSSLLPANECTIEEINNSLDAFLHSTTVCKKNLIYICGSAARKVSGVNSQSFELVRMVADAVGLSVPPFVYLKTSERVF